MNKEPELVDLGLPSGNLWMTKNLGAESETDPGNYYQFGSLKGYSGKEAIGRSYWSTCPFNNGNYMFNEKYFLKNRYKWLYKNGILKPEFDIVTQTYGKGFKIPEPKDFQELIDNTTNEVSTEKSGRLFTSKINGKTLFFPISGYIWCGSRVASVSSDTRLWSSRLNSSDSRCVYCFYYNSDNVDLGNFNRFLGFTIRGIKVRNE